MSHEPPSTFAQEVPKEAVHEAISGGSLGGHLDVQGT